MSNYYFLLVLMIILSGLYYIKRFSKTLIGLVPLMALIILVGVCVAKDVTKLNLFVLEPWRFFIITFMGVLSSSSSSSSSSSYTFYVHFSMG